jgi:predicted HTH domain antitoxin
MEITLSVPERCLREYSPDEFADRIKLYAALMMFSSAELSAGAAAQLAGVDRHTFMMECGRRGIPTIDYDPDELRAEVSVFSVERR